jgi:hypothetical protein
LGANTLRQNVENMIIYITTFVVVNDIYDYYDYSAYGLIAETIIIGHSHNRMCFLQPQSHIYIQYICNFNF